MIYYVFYIGAVCYDNCRVQRLLPSSTEALMLEVVVSVAPPQLNHACILLCFDGADKLLFFVALLLQASTWCAIFWFEKGYCKQKCILWAFLVFKLTDAYFLWWQMCSRQKYFELQTKFIVKCSSFHSLSTVLKTEKWKFS